MSALDRLVHLRAVRARDVCDHPGIGAATVRQQVERQDEGKERHRGGRQHRAADLRHFGGDCGHHLRRILGPSPHDARNRHGHAHRDTLLKRGDAADEQLRFFRERRHGRQQQGAECGERQGTDQQHGQTPLESPPFQPLNDRLERDGEDERHEQHHHDGPDLQPDPDERRCAQDLQDGQPGHVEPNALGSWRAHRRSSRRSPVALRIRLVHRAKTALDLRR
jgi:hypothetical protein